jgi:hypothetical protein
MFGASRAEKVAVQRMGQPVLGHRESSRPQGLRGDLTAEQGRTLDGPALVVPAVQVGIELLDVEQFDHIGHSVVGRH